MQQPIHRRLKHALAVLTGRITLPPDLTSLELRLAMADYSAALARVNTGLDRLISESAANKAAAAAAASAADAVNTQINADLSAVADKIEAASPVPVAAPAADTSSASVV